MLKFNKSVYEWLCENKWKETTRKINNKVGTERVCVSLIPSLASIWFRMYLVLSIGGVTVTPLFAPYVVLCVTYVNQVANCQHFALETWVCWLPQEVLFAFPTPLTPSLLLLEVLAFFCFFLWLFAFLSLSVCFSRKFAATAAPGTEQQDQPRNGYQFLSFFSIKKKQK